MAYLNLSSIYINGTGNGSVIIHVNRLDFTEFDPYVMNGGEAAKILIDPIQLGIKYPDHINPEDFKGPPKKRVKIEDVTGAAGDGAVKATYVIDTSYAGPSDGDDEVDEGDIP